MSTYNCGFIANIGLTNTTSACPGKAGVVDLEQPPGQQGQWNSQFASAFSCRGPPATQRNRQLELAIVVAVIRGRRSFRPGQRTASAAILDADDDVLLGFLNGNISKHEALRQTARAARDGGYGTDFANSADPEAVEHHAHAVRVKCGGGGDRHR